MTIQSTAQKLQELYHGNLEHVNSTIQDADKNFQNRHHEELKHQNTAFRSTAESMQKWMPIRRPNKHMNLRSPSAVKDEKCDVTEK